MTLISSITQENRELIKISIISELLKTKVNNFTIQFIIQTIHTLSSSEIKSLFFEYKVGGRFSVLDRKTLETIRLYMAIRRNLISKDCIFYIYKTILELSLQNKSKNPIQELVDMVYFTHPLVIKAYKDEQYILKYLLPEIFFKNTGYISHLIMDRASKKQIGEIILHLQQILKQDD